MLFHMCVQKLTGDLAEGPSDCAISATWRLGISISAFCGPIIAGNLIDHAGAGVSFGASFAASTVLIIVAFILLQVALDASPVRHACCRSRPAPVPAALRDLLQSAEMRRLYLAVVMTSTAWDVHMFLVPIQGSRIGLSASQIGVVMASFAVATFVIRVALPVIARHFTEWQMITAVQLVASVVYLIYAAGQQPLRHDRAVVRARPGPGCWQPT
jgi:MFS family permease